MVRFIPLKGATRVKKHLFILTALAVVVIPAFAQAAPPTKLNTSGALFGVRENVQHMDISPDGSRVVYVTPGPGRTTAVFVAELAGGTPQRVIQSAGNPDRMTWCNFVGNSWLICRITGLVDHTGTLVPYTRLIALDTTGKNVRPLGQQSSFYDSRPRQFDGEVLDWLPGEDSAVLMARDYVPEEGTSNTMIVRKADGLGIDRIDVSTMKSTRIEAAKKQVDFFTYPGHEHNVRGKDRVHLMTKVLDYIDLHFKECN